MRKILLLSDTHGHLDEAILKYCRSADEIWHAGDIGNIDTADRLAEIKPLIGVYGNIDGDKLRVEYPKEQFFICEQKKVWITHIGGYPGNYPTFITSKIKLLKPDIFICGHSHILKVIYDKKYNLLHLNPGAAGIYGFHPIRTMLRFTIDAGKISNMEVIELGMRGKIQL